MPKYFTKSAFTMSLECPRRLYYAYDKDVYANQDSDDEFLKSLAEGGFQVGEFAKLCYGIGAANNIKTLDPAEAVRQTKELLSQENVNIPEAAFLVGSMFVRADIIEKKGDVINLSRLRRSTGIHWKIPSFQRMESPQIRRSVHIYMMWLFRNISLFRL